MANLIPVQYSSKPIDLLKYIKEDCIYNNMSSKKQKSAKLDSAPAGMDGAVDCESFRAKRGDGQLSDYPVSRIGRVTYRFLGKHYLTIDLDDIATVIPGNKLEAVHLHAEDPNMPTLQVRDLPEDVYYRLQQRAKEEHRSVAQETIVLLRRALEQPESPTARREAALTRIQQRKLEDIPEFPSSDAVIREDRER